jgi:hypothetical protein
MRRPPALPLAPFKLPQALAGGLRASFDDAMSKPAAGILGRAFGQIEWRPRGKLRGAVGGWGQAHSRRRAIRIVEDEGSRALSGDASRSLFKEAANKTRGAHSGASRVVSSPGV